MQSFQNKKIGLENGLNKMIQLAKNYEKLPRMHSKRLEFSFIITTPVVDI